MPTTPNKGYSYPVHGGAVNSWDTDLDVIFNYVDLNVAGPYPLTITSTTAAITYNSSYASVGSAATTITPPSSLAQNLFYTYSGTMTNNQDVAFPAAGGIYVINNTSSGAYDLKAVVSGSTTVNVTVPQGGTNIVVTNGTSMFLANSNVLATKMKSYFGNPNGNVAGTVAVTNGGSTDFDWDVTNKILYATDTTGTAATTVWEPVAAKLTPQGMLTISTDNDNPIIASNTTSTSVKYVPYNGNWTLLSDGTTVYPYQFSAMTLTLTASQAANIIYDVFLYYNSGTPVIGTGPAWSVSTAGSGSRGAGAGTTQISRLLGIWTNTVAVTLTNSITTYACPASQGVYLGSIFVDTAAGNVTCHTAWGQDRKWGVWNCYNRVPIIMQEGDSTASWNIAAWRVANGSTSNKITSFCGLPEENIFAEAAISVQAATSVGTAANIAIGVNSTSSPSGFYPTNLVFSGAASYRSVPGNYSIAPMIGTNNIYFLENLSSGVPQAVGGNSNMVMYVRYMG